MLLFELSAFLIGGRVAAGKNGIENGTKLGVEET